MLVRGDPAMLAMSAAACVFVVSAVRSIGLLSATAQQNFEMTYALE